MVGGDGVRLRQLRLPHGSLSLKMLSVMFMYTYIYIERELEIDREREREIHTLIAFYVSMLYAISIEPFAKSLNRGHTERPHPQKSDLIT